MAAVPDEQVAARLQGGGEVEAADARHEARTTIAQLRADDDRSRPAPRPVGPPRGRRCRPATAPRTTRAGSASARVAPRRPAAPRPASARQVAPGEVGRFEALGKGGRLVGVVGQEEGGRIGRVADPAGGIEPRGERRRRRSRGRHVGRGDAGPGEEGGDPRPRRRRAADRARAGRWPGSRRGSGATSETVPMIARSARSRAASGAAGDARRAGAGRP